MLHGEWGETLNEMFDRYVRVLELYRVKKCGTKRCNLLLCECWHNDNERRRSAWDACGRCNDLLTNKTSTSYTPLKYKTERCKRVSCPFGKNCSFAHKGEALLQRRTTAPTRNKWMLQTWEVFAFMESKMTEPSPPATDDFPALERSVEKRQKTAPLKPISAPHPCYTAPPARRPVLNPTEVTKTRPPANTKTIRISEYHQNALSIHKGLVDTLNGLLDILCDHVQVNESFIEYRARRMDCQLEALARTRIDSFLGDFGDEYESTHRVWCSSSKNQLCVMKAIDTGDQQSIFEFEARANAHASNISGTIFIRVLRSTSDHEKTTFDVMNKLLSYTSSAT